ERQEAELLPLDQGLLADGTPVVDDPEALLAAEAAVRGENPFESAWEASAESSWVSVLSRDRNWSGGMLTADADLVRAHSALNDAGIPTGWDPAPPGEDHNPYSWHIVQTARRFSLLVPEEYADQAKEILEAEGLWSGP
ncbi:MAG: hypothetical protein HY876_07905, partial [Coriobacteriales bacterium]|nr:hypothetical protein [Coriobacteriales bacterium]